ncbi:MAG: hypothetical protein AB8Y66_01600 [Coxiella-like endosymbiont]
MEKICMVKLRNKTMMTRYLFCLVFLIYQVYLVFLIYQVYQAQALTLLIVLIARGPKSLLDSYSEHD